MTFIFPADGASTDAMLPCNPQIFILTQRLSNFCPADVGFVLKSLSKTVDPHLMKIW